MCAGRLAATGGSIVCAVHIVEATELIALDLFNSGGRQITIGDVDAPSAVYAAIHRSAPCGRCSAAAMVRPDRVLMVVRAWQRQQRATRVAALH